MPDPYNPIHTIYMFASLEEQNAGQLSEANRRLAIAAPGSQAFATAQADVASIQRRGKILEGAKGDPINFMKSVTDFLAQLRRLWG